jgi:hypothetical protein
VAAANEAPRAKVPARAAVSPSAPLLEPKNYRPTLVPITVPLQKLLLDPNNPRILRDHDIPEDQFADPGIQAQALDRMREGDFKLAQLRDSVIENGWQPVDMIFVKRLPGDHFVVLEGNRRVVALRMIEAKHLTPELKRSIDPLPVLEVVGSGDANEWRAQITYLLGVRHHGSLKTWAPFARAHNMYERYLRVGEMSDATFKWNDKVAEHVADTLSVSFDDVKQALKVYRAMRQLNEHERIAKVGIEGRYYSVIGEVLLRRTGGPLKKYVAQDPVTFLLDEPSVDRIDAVCHFSTKGREGAPISNPAEWRSLENILKDPDDTRKRDMLKAVEQEGKKPSEVYAMRAAELRQPRWDRWLKEVAELLNKLVVGELEETTAATTACRKLAGVLDKLGLESGRKAVKS